MIQTCYFGPGKHGTYFPLMNNYLQSLNMYHPICGRNEKKQTVKQKPLLSVIRCINEYT
jgi:hypothetical protein